MVRVHYKSRGRVLPVGLDPPRAVDGLPLPPLPVSGGGEGRRRNERRNIIVLVQK